MKIPCEKLPGKHRADFRTAESVKTERLTVRVCSADEMTAMINAEETEEMKAAYHEMLDGCLAHPNEWKWYAMWRIEETATGKEIGNLCFKGLHDGMTEIGYGIRDDSQNRGFATEAVRAVSVWASGQDSVLRLEAETEPDNKISQRVLEKCGYVPTGEAGAEGPRFVFQK